jgi:hypothetical protein
VAITCTFRRGGGLRSIVIMARKKQGDGIALCRNPDLLFFRRTVRSPLAFEGSPSRRPPAEFRHMATVYSAAVDLGAIEDLPSFRRHLGGKLQQKPYTPRG